MTDLQGGWSHRSRQQHLLRHLWSRRLTGPADPLRGLRLRCQSQTVPPLPLRCYWCHISLRFLKLKNNRNHSADICSRDGTCTTPDGTNPAGEVESLSPAPGDAAGGITRDSSRTLDPSYEFPWQALRRKVEERRTERERRRRGKHLSRLKSVLWLRIYENLISFLVQQDNVRRGGGLDLLTDPPSTGQVHGLAIRNDTPRIVPWQNEGPLNVSPTIRTVPDCSFGRGRERKKTWLK